jgi:hypothetical protein
MGTNYDNLPLGDYGDGSEEGGGNSSVIMIVAVLLVLCVCMSCFSCSVGEIASLLYIEYKMEPDSTAYKTIFAPDDT